MAKKNKRATPPKRQPKIVDHISDSDDEEIDEDEAFNSEDERKYGAFFSKKKKKASNNNDDSEDDEQSDDDESDDGIASDDDDDEGDGGNYMLDLLNKLDVPSEERNKRDRRGDRNPAALVKESEFAASVIRSDEKLTLDDLMEGLSDTKGFGVMQKTMKEVARGKAAPAPVAKVVSDRAQRKVAYQHSSKDVSGWIDVVQQNRQAETLDFRPKERPDILTKNQLVDKFEPTTDFEKELATALKDAGQSDEKAIQRMEEELLKAEELDTNELTLEEYQKRRGQLAKMRALMFYHEQKRHHINKIKSKKYRRIRKKQRERTKDAELNQQMEEDPDLARELKEKEEVERMQERMTLAHKNTSKWAKRVLKRGKNVDVDTRRALSAQVARGDELRRKMDSTQGGENESGSDSENEDLVETARKVLADAEEDSGPTKSAGLFALSFMQKGIEKQRQRAKEEARQLLRELEDNEADADSDAAEEEAPKKKKKKVASASEMKGVMESGKLVANSLNFGASNTIAVDGGIEIDLGGSSTTPGNKGATAKASSSEHTTTLAVKQRENSDTKEKASDKRQGKSPTVVVQAATKSAEEESNPWLAASEDPETKQGSSKKKSKKSKNAGVDKRGIVDVEGAAAIFEEEAVSQKGKNTSVDDTADNKNIVSLTQEELVRRAFVAPTEQEVDDEFAKEKAEAEERDDPTNKKKEVAPNTVNGWGSWAGEGAPAPRPPRKLPKHLRPPEKKKPKRKRQDENKPNLIINEKRMKKTANAFQIAHIPYPYKSREEYERAMAGGIGKEWNVSSGFKNLTRPEIMTRAGKMIQPISKKAKQKRPAAKF